MLGRSLASLGSSGIRHDRNSSSIRSRVFAIALGLGAGPRASTFNAMSSYRGESMERVSSSFSKHVRMPLAVKGLLDPFRIS